MVGSVEVEYLKADTKVAHVHRGDLECASDAPVARGYAQAEERRPDARVARDP